MNRFYVMALTLGLAATPAVPVMAQTGTYQSQETQRPSDDKDQNQQHPWSEDQNQGAMQGQDRDHSTSTSQQGQYGQDRDDQSRQNKDNGTWQSGQDRDHDRDQNSGTWQGSDKDRSSRDRDDQNRSDDQGWSKDRDNDHSRVSSGQDYTNSKFYKLGYQDGSHDRDKNSRREHNRNFKSDDDRRAYEAGYDAAFGRQH